MYGLNSDFQKRDVAIYARVSTEHEAQLSALENQIDWYKPILEARPDWTLTAQYIDEGITGTSAEKRPRFMQMIEDARQRKFDMIITREVSRFARNHTIGVNRHAVFGRVSLPHLTFLATEDQHQRKYY